MSLYELSYVKTEIKGDYHMKMEAKIKVIHLKDTKFRGFQKTGWRHEILLQSLPKDLYTLGLLASKVKVKSLSHVRLFATPWTVAYQAPASMGFSRQKYWSGLPFPSPEYLLNQKSRLGAPHCRQTLYHLSHQGSPFSL